MSLRALTRLPKQPLLATLAAALCATICVGLVLRAQFAVEFPCTADDAFIAFRYAQNLALGNGLVFNTGERVWGYTSPLLVLLLGGLALLGAPIAQTCVVIGSCASGISAVVIQRMLARVYPPFWALVVALFCLTAKVSFDYVGMESDLVVVLECVFLLLLVAERPAPAAFVASLACLARPDALVLVAPALLLTRKARTLRAFAWFALPGTAWLIFARGYYGEWIPNSFYAKQGSTPFIAAISSYAQLLNNFPLVNRHLSFVRMAPGRSLLVASILNGAVTALSLAEPKIRKSFIWIFTLIIYPWLLCLLYALIGPTLGHDWEIESALFFNFLGLGVGLMSAGRALAAWLGKRAAAHSPGAIGREAFTACISSLFIGLVALPIGKNFRDQLGGPRWMQSYYWGGLRHKTYLLVARWLNENATGLTFACGEPGTIAFYTTRSIIDMGRIVTKTEPKEAPDLYMLTGNVERWSSPWGPMYERTHYIPTQGFEDISIMKRIDIQASHSR